MLSEKKAWMSTIDGHRSVTRVKTPHVEKSLFSFKECGYDVGFGGIVVCKQDDDEDVGARELGFFDEQARAFANFVLQSTEKENTPHFFGGYSVADGAVFSGGGALAERSNDFYTKWRDADSQALLAEFFHNTQPQKLGDWPLEVMVSDDGLFRFVSSGMGAFLLRRKAGLDRVPQSVHDHRVNNCFDLSGSCPDDPKKATASSEVTPVCTLLMYEDKNFKGKVTTVTTTDENGQEFTDKDFDGSDVSSFKVSGCSSVELYDDDRGGCKRGFGDNIKIDGDAEKSTIEWDLDDDICGVFLQALPPAAATDTGTDTGDEGCDPSPPNAAFCADLKWMAEYEVRESFERYGATAFFDIDHKLIQITRPANREKNFKKAPEAGMFVVHRPRRKKEVEENEGQWLDKPPAEYTPTEVKAMDKQTQATWMAAERNNQQWEHAKWVMRTSVMTETTVIDHLLWAHLIVSNGVCNAAYSQLSPSHRIRQILKAFCYRSNTINYSAYMTLTAEDGMADHWFAFTRPALAAYMEKGSRSFKYKDPEAYFKYAFGIEDIRSISEQSADPKFCAKLGIEGECTKENVLEHTNPTLLDGYRLYKVYTRYTKKFVNSVYADDEDLRKDTEILAYWDDLHNRRVQGHTPDGKKRTEKEYGFFPNTKKYKTENLSRHVLAKQLAHLMWYVTGFHKLVGQLSDPMIGGARAIGTQIRPGRNEADVMGLFGQNTLAAYTGFPQINIINPWDHVFEPPLTEGMAAAAKNWQKDLIKLADQIDELNTKRPEYKLGIQSANYFNPRYLDSSIAI